MKLSARNQLRGKIVSIKEGAVEAQVSLDVGGQHLSAVITMEAVKELGLTEGMEAVAIVKADNVMIAID